MPHVNPVQVQKFLKGVDYPASKQDLIDNAKNLGADENVCSSLEKLPDEDFQTPAEVSQAIGKQSDGASPSSGSSSSSGADEFLMQAAQDSLGEIELCELALEKSESDDIKQFAQQMIDEHGKLGQDIEQLCQRKKVAVPSDAGKEHEASIQKMSKLSGSAFDKKFIEQNVQDHEKDIKVFNHYAEQGDDADIKSLAKNAVKMLSSHLDMAKQLASGSA
jgi:putative membrane protein